MPLTELPRVATRWKVSAAGVLDYPLTTITAGHQGIVVTSKPDIIRVKMDDTFPELAEWGNCVEFYPTTVPDDLARFYRSFERIKKDVTRITESMKITAAAEPDINVALARLMQIAAISGGDCGGVMFSGPEWDPEEEDGWKARTLDERLDAINEWLAIEATFDDDEPAPLSKSERIDKMTALLRDFTECGKSTDGSHFHEDYNACVERALELIGADDEEDDEPAITATLDEYLGRTPSED